MSDTKRLFAENLRKLSVKELVQKRKELRKKLYEYKIQNELWTLKQTHLIKFVRKNIARVNTILRERINELYPDQAKKK